MDAAIVLFDWVSCRQCAGTGRLGVNGKFRCGPCAGYGMRVVGLRCEAVADG